MTSSAAAALPTATGAAVAFLKKLVYRAAGDEGLAENIPVPGAPQPMIHANAGIVEQLQQPLKETVDKIVHRTEYQQVPCIDTSGQAFAIYLNLIYLAPLTGLFVRFFVKSYLRRTSTTIKHPTKRTAITKSTRDAIHGVDREIESLGKAAEDGISTAVNKAKNVRGRQVKANGNGDARVGSLSPANQKFVDSFNRKVTQRLEEMGEGAEATAERAKKIAKEVVSSASTPKSERAMSPNGKA